jgi:outer membrane lipoprotein-sorting protein
MNKILIVILILFSSTSLKAQNAKEIIRKADKKWQGLSNYTEMKMTIVRPKYSRNIEFKSWSKDRNYSITLITAPAREKGQSFLKRKNDMWTWNPNINRFIKLPTSMMSQGWMGSDFTNDDVLKESSIVNDYTHKILKEEMIDDILCYKIEMLPTENAVVVWGKLIKWISKDAYDQLKTEYYDEDDDLIKSEYSKDIKNFDGKLIPSIIEIHPTDKPGNKTIVEIKIIKYNIKVKDNFFSQQNMKRLK